MDRLGIHVINAGVGESIIVEIPGGGWGVVDCYASVLDDPSSNPTITFLRKRNIKELEFFCLTHPHGDHYRGLNQLLNYLDKLRYFWRFGAFTDRDLKGVLLKYFKALGIETRHSWLIEEANELTYAFGKIDDMQKEGKIARQFALSDFKHIYPLPIDEEQTPEFQIASIAPSTDMIHPYQQAIAKCFDEQGRLIGRVLMQRHNDVSVALRLQYGKSRVILGGDVEAANWVDTIKTISSSGLRAHAVKVSHHGSITGYTPDLWDHFSRDTQPHAVVTPYRRFGLPKRAALIHISAHTSALLTTCRSATLGETPIDFEFWSAYDITSRAVMTRVYSNWRPGELPAKCGICSLLLDKEGGCQAACDGDACFIKYNPTTGQLV
jgi:beta-lactamase superfamily II metal-dependent hydrolase